MITDFSFFEELAKMQRREPIAKQPRKRCTRPYDKSESAEKRKSKC